VPAEVRRVPFGAGLTLHVSAHGPDAPDAPVVVFGHSLLCDGEMFDAQVADLARDHRVLNVDFRGHGRSDAPLGAYTMADQGQDYARVLDAFGVESAAIVGLSMGGMAALHFALASPARVRALALLDTSAGPERLAKRARYGALATMARLFGVGRWLSGQAIGVMFGETFRREHPEVVERWAGKLRTLDRRALARAVKMVTSRPSVVAELGRVEAPTLVVVGDEDVATPPSVARQLAAHIPGARLEVLPRTGHLSTVEQPELMGKLLRAFLVSVRRTSGRSSAG